MEKEQDVQEIGLALRAYRKNLIGTNLDDEDVARYYKKNVSMGSAMLNFVFRRWVLYLAFNVQMSPSSNNF